jgi:hypothetical protein
MKRILYSVVIVLAAIPATAGLTYDFHTSTTGLQASEQQGRVTADGANLRMEFSTGDNAMFHNGAVMVSHNSGATIDVLDPQEKTYWELDLSSLNAGPLADMVKMTNEKVNVRDAGDGGTIEGYPTHHTIVTASADMSIGGAPAGMHLELTMESWTTDKIPAEAAAFLHRRAGSSGLPMLDKLIAAQSDSIKGFPLKSITTMKVAGGANMEMTSTTNVTNIKKANVAPASFEVPKDYKKTQNPVEKMMGASAPQ